MYIAGPLHSHVTSQVTNTNTNTNNIIFHRILKQNNISWKLLFDGFYIHIYTNIIQTIYSS